MTGCGVCPGRPPPSASHARRLWAGPDGIWTSRGTFYRWGIRLTGLGGLLAASAVGYLLLGG
ncbi:hypothetical protein GO001_31200 [Streptomyces sp. NRRL B-1677]|uniref:hypothetical protein n=1 Tax=Streptomyces sp. NRRL B-1677 TaxID=2682966 RepID=UPI001E65CA93|nr:hypothetical protein [Streptomyces sp. NRRL B-1677]MBF6049601.1 hypothetical protein [Streptomyces sp. NRRL B-1677]